MATMWWLWRSQRTLLCKLPAMAWAQHSSRRGHIAAKATIPTTQVRATYTAVFHFMHFNIYHFILYCACACDICDAV
jgi:hypothetical protein